MFVITGAWSVACTSVSSQMTLLQRKFLILFLSNKSFAATPISLIFIREGWIVNSRMHRRVACMVTEAEALSLRAGALSVSHKCLLNLCIKAIPESWGYEQQFLCTKWTQARILCCSHTAFRWSFPFMLLICMYLDLLTWRGRLCVWMWLAEEPACSTLSKCRSSSFWVFSVGIDEIIKTSKQTEGKNPQSSNQTLKF